MKTILVVDDSAVDRRLAGGLLERSTGWNIVYATDGKLAQEKIRQSPPDLVVTDLMMPEMNGLELVSAVKSEFPYVPVILMTAKGSEEIAVRALELGAASYVPKSRLAKELRETAEQVLAASGKHRLSSHLSEFITETSYAFLLENDLTLVPVLVNYLQQDLTRLQLCDETERLRVGVALEAAVVNAIVHGNLEFGTELQDADEDVVREQTGQRSHESPYRDRRVHVTARTTRSEAVYVVRDDGPGIFAVAALSDPDVGTNLDEPSGRELLLMRTLMDEVTFNDQGNEVTLVKKLQPGW